MLCSYKSLLKQTKSQLLKGQARWVKAQISKCVDVSEKEIISEQPSSTFGHGTLSSSRTRSKALLRERVFKEHVAHFCFNLWRQVKHAI